MASNRENYVELNCFLIPQANHILQELFLKQWKKCTKEDWNNTVNQGNTFITGIGKRAWITGTRRQKLLLECGNIYLWDLRLCNHILQKTEFGLSKREKVLLNDLSTLQNVIFRNYKVLMSNKERRNMTKKIEDILKQFEEPFEDVLDKYQSTDPANEFTALHLKELGNSLFVKERKNREAIRSYTQAIELPEITNKLLGELYSNRSAVYLAIKNQRNFTHLALEDSKRAIQLLPVWFRGYYRLGCAYQSEEKYEKAFKYFSIAVELDPGQIETIALRDECEKKIPKPKTPREMLFEKDIGSFRDPLTGCQTEITANKIQELMNSAEKESEDYFFWKAIYMMGYEESPDYNHILELLWKLADKAHLLALYYIASMYRLGVGVEKNMEKSIKLVKQIASGPKSEKLMNNHGIALAENDLGHLYAKGIGLPIDLEESIKLFQRAAEHGNSLGAINLGLFYICGKGVERNEEKGVQYLNLAAKQFDASAMFCLAQYYLVDAQDTKQAMEWHRRAVAHGSPQAVTRSDEFLAEVKRLKSKFEKIDKEMSRWEESSRLTETDLSMTERRKRYLNDSTYIQTVTKVEDTYNKQQLPFSKDKKFGFDIKVLEDYAKKGSLLAKELKKALVHFNVACEWLKLGNIVKCIHHLAESIRISELVVDPSVCQEAIARLNDYDAEVPSPFDRDVKICITLNFLMSFEQTSDFVKQCIQDYPAEIWFRQLQAATYAFMHDRTEGLKVVNSALEKFPDDHNLWYAKISFLNLAPRTKRKVLMRACEKYLALAPLDERHVPRIYYLMGMRCSGNKNEASEYYKKGLDAEKLQLPYFLPFECGEKLLLESITSSLQSVDKNVVAPVVDEVNLNKLTDPARVMMIIAHRTKVVEMRLFLGKVNAGKKVLLNATWDSGLTQKAPPRATNVQPILFKEMDPLVNRIYKHRALSGVVIEEPVLGMSGVHVILKDENGDVERTSVYNIDQDSSIHNKLGYGCRITILNPFFKIALDGKQAIRVDDVDSVIFVSSRDMSMCRFCGKVGAVLKCSRCHRAAYCDKQCQTNDWLF